MNKPVESKSPTMASVVETGKKAIAPDSVPEPENTELETDATPTVDDKKQTLDARVNQIK